MSGNLNNWCGDMLKVHVSSSVNHAFVLTFVHVQKSSVLSHQSSVISPLESQCDIGMPTML